MKDGEKVGGKDVEEQQSGSQDFEVVGRGYWQLNCGDDGGYGGDGGSSDGGGGSGSVGDGSISNDGDAGLEKLCVARVAGRGHGSRPIDRATYPRHRGIVLDKWVRSRKRRPSSSNDSERSYSGWSERIPHGCGREGCRTNERGDCMDECTAALVLMSLSCSPHSPHNPLPLHCQHNYGSWGSRGGGGGGVVVGSPGVGGTSNSSSSSSGASWRSGTPSPPLSDEGAPTTGSLWPTPAHVSHINQAHYPCNLSGSSSSSTPGSTITMDEGIVPDYLEEQHPRKKKIRAKADRDPIESEPGSCATFESEQVQIRV
uniref:Uncharacterized protein n=1 Tax=Vespula pensylvanica TaxID=30213 RepID=A0A834PDV2_VESPE|nr:hypothetical protein H0235_000293 [Vespula pensylvanica]